MGYKLDKVFVVMVFFNILKSLKGIVSFRLIPISARVLVFCRTEKIAGYYLAEW